MDFAMLSTKIFVYFVKNLFFCCGMWYNVKSNKKDIHTIKYSYCKGEKMRNRSRALNAAACINNYTPSSLNELIRNNQYFKEKSQ